MHRSTEREEWAEVTSGLYGVVYEERAGTLRAVGQGTRNDIADALRALVETVTMAGHRVFDVDVLADMIERGMLAPMTEACDRPEPHDVHRWYYTEGVEGPTFTRQCWGVSAPG